MAGISVHHTFPVPPGPDLRGLRSERHRPGGGAKPVLPLPGQTRGTFLLIFHQLASRSEPDSTGAAIALMPENNSL